MSFADDLKRWTEKVQTKSHAVFVNTASAALESIRSGSPLTGAPGQPVDTGTLRASWHLTFESPTRALISTNIAYAPVIEENARTAYDPNGVQPKRAPSTDGGTRRIKSTVGGHHSVRQTRVNLQRIVDAEAEAMR